MSEGLRICLALADENLNETFAAALRGAGHNPWPVYNAPSTLSRLGHVLCDVLIAEPICSRVDGASFLPFVRRVYPEVRIVALEHVAGGEWLAEERAHVDAMATDVASVLQALRAP